jgi:anti-sigma factor ChrR (cupin superfamily)
LLPIPRSGAGEAYLARFAAGVRFPAHRHQGHEDVLLLEGSYTDASGNVYRSGDLHHMDAGSLHHFDIARDEPCVAAAVHHGIEFSSVLLRLLAKFFG